MPGRQFEWLNRIKAVQQEHSATRFALDHLQTTIQRDPTVLPRDPILRVRHVREAAGHLDGTYVIRLFAEFETGLRSFWTASRTKGSPTRTRDLIDGIAARQGIADELRTEVHEAREYRNAMIHHQDDKMATISIDDFRRRLCEFFARLPIDW